jgi:hypothetical protein
MLENNKKILQYSILIILVFFSVLLLSLFNNKVIYYLIYHLASFFIFLFFILVFFRRFHFVVNFLVAWVLSFVFLCLEVYFFTTGTKLDFFFLARGWGNITYILGPYVGFLVFLVALSVAISLILCFVVRVVFQKANIKKLTWFHGVFFICFLIIFFVYFSDRNTLFYFTKSAFQIDPVLESYESYYNQELKSIESSFALDSYKKKDLPEYLDNIIFLQIESLNSFLINEENTPNFLELAKEGIYFPGFYGNSVQTITGQANLLCSMPTSFGSNLAKNKNVQNLQCLPNIFNNLGYDTFFLKSYDLDFDNTGEFMQKIGFKEVHSNDLMKDNDPAYPWGYREDVFYQRSFEYLNKNIKNNNNFIYIEIGPTNHWPFNTPKDFVGEVPYSNPESHKERLINTTFIQDAYLREAWRSINDLFPKKNYTLFLVGDHSWPAEFHEGNVFNQRGAYEENFLSSMVVIFGGQEKYKNKIINTRYSLMDVYPSLSDLFELNFGFGDFRKSFIPEINGSTSADHQILLIQPYSEKYINVIDKNIKYQYNSEEGVWHIYNLLKDETPMLYSDKEEKNLEILKNLFN